MTTTQNTIAFTSTIRASGKTPAQFFPRRRAELVEAAEVSTSLASTLIGYGDNAAASDLIVEVRAMLAEIAKIDGLRKNRA